MLLFPAMTTGQARIDVPDEPSCRSCTIERRLLATLTEGDYPGSLSVFSNVTVLSDGRFLVGNLSGAPPYLADRSGVVRRQIGRVGEGPGEYRGMLFGYETLDAFHVLDFALRRWTRLSKDSLSLLGSVRLPFGLGWPAVLPDGSLIVSAAVASREAVGYPLHLVSASGQVIRSFGPVRGTIRTGSPGTEMRIVATATPSTVFVAERTSYRIEVWDTAGTRTRSSCVRADGSTVLFTGSEA
jgi:hypothetical protein